MYVTGVTYIRLAALDGEIKEGAGMELYQLIRANRSR